MELGSPCYTTIPDLNAGKQRRNLGEGKRGGPKYFTSVKSPVKIQAFNNLGTGKSTHIPWTWATAIL